jgi:hypothetical protein
MDDEEKILYYEGLYIKERDYEIFGIQNEKMENKNKT